MAVTPEERKEIIAEVLDSLAQRPDAPQSLREARDPVQRARSILMAKIREHNGGGALFGLDEARAMFQQFEDELGVDPLTRAWRQLHGRAPWEKGTMYPVRNFGGKNVSFCPSSDCHRTGADPQVE